MTVQEKKAISVRRDYPWIDLVESQPWRVVDKAAWDRLESLRIAQQHGAQVRNNVDAQAVAIHKLHLYAPPCWLCGQRNMWYFAVGCRVKVEFENRKFRCIHCGIELKHTVPLVAVSLPWYWRRPEGITPAAIHPALLRWEKANATAVETT